MCSRLRRAMLLLGTTILVLQTAFMPIGMYSAETTMDTDEHEPVELPSTQNSLEELTTDPNFSFQQSDMQGIVNSPIHVTISSDQEVSEVKVRLPEEATIVKDQLSEGTSVVQGDRPNEWIVQSESVRTTFVLPLVFESEGNYELFLEDTTAMIEINRQEVAAEEELTTDQEQSEDISDTNVSEKYSQNNSSDSLDTRNIVSVSTATQFRNAFNNTSVTRINLANNISLGQSLNRLTRNLEINGNGFQLFTGNQHIPLGDNSVLRLINLELLVNQPPSVTAIQIGGRNAQIILNNFDYRNNNVVLANTFGSGSSYSVIFAGGVTNLSRGSNASGIFGNVNSIEIFNDSIVNLSNGRLSFSNIKSEFNISEGSTLNINNVSIRSLNTFIVEGKADIIIKNANLGLIENVRIESTGEFLLNSDWNYGTIDSRTKNIEIMRGSTFDIKNSAGASVTNGDIDISIDSESLALWDLGLQEEEKASIVFSDIQTTLSGTNASIIDTTTNERFQKLYDSSGLAAYSRISNRSVEEMTRTVIAKYLDTEGNEIIEPEVITGLLGDNYQTKGKIIPGYQLVENPSNESGEFSRETIEVSYIYDAVNVTPKDPLDPETEITPESKPELPEDQGLLSIDFASTFKFGVQAISVHDQIYYAQPQRLLNEDGTVNESEERPNYVQISDRRPESERNGWELAVTQKEQFKGKENQVLNGASINLSNQQVVSAQGGTAPGLQSVPCELIPGNRRTLLKAQGNEGMGTWIYRFGNAETADKSIALNVPRGANPEATRYSTTLIWELSAVPDN